ncbi:hypothetical protein BDP55DRAFT_394767 [Colletotrichum godetiae]|uniref:Uncharacterized protein n=1 Tax=Colletotrichum godetiae TaxID=1209918 RepID=A0AAJ0A9M9_9PEZI|nr:uncharacterized protein BDP55DRAFT_394767 [Colletotrichum godetiae]KAK1658529.1 hypothetical protein BDP55DRAFT_394767 [Colletotrichum godetiae]
MDSRRKSSSKRARLRRSSLCLDLRTEKRVMSGPISYSHAVRPLLSHKKQIKPRPSHFDFLYRHQLQVI